MIECATTNALIDAIQRLAVRGAPALGAAGAYGVALAMAQGKRESWNSREVEDAIDAIRHARPTAVNLAWGVDQVRPIVAEGFDAVLTAARQIAIDDEQANRALAHHGATWALKHITHRPIRVLTHCNTGTLATTAWGTALGVVRELHQREALGMVYADETRPLLQGSRLTAWELQRDGIDYRIQVDSAAASTILRGLVDIAIIGADRIAANGDTANKIGSVGVALACQAAGIPFMVAAPASTVDLSTPDGSTIHIEERDSAEVLLWGGIEVAPEGARTHNPAFDVTPHTLISAITTEYGIVTPGTGPQLADVIGHA
jgi:methylthioribose-1-phosphate isomerase